MSIPGSPKDPVRHTKGPMGRHTKGMRLTIYNVFK